jgi:hypothetical protein
MLDYPLGSAILEQMQEPSVQAEKQISANDVLVGRPNLQKLLSMQDLQPLNGHGTEHREHEEGNVCQNDERCPIRF